MELITVLEKTAFGNQHELEAARNFLEQAAIHDLPNLLRQLSDILRNTSQNEVTRAQAAIQLKNALYSKDETIKIQHQERWVQIPEEIRLYIKNNCIETLGTETKRPSQAAQCVGYLACAELPKGLWPDCINRLMINVTDPNATEMLKESSLEAIGYICQDINPDILESQSNQILTAIVNGMRKEERSDHVRLAACNALLNSLEFTRNNFSKESERNYIMQIICEATQSDNPQIKISALQNLVRIMNLYYEFMENYMGQALFAITVSAMKSSSDDVALQGIEFWSSVCEEECELAAEYQEALEEGRTPTSVSRHYARGALQYLVPIILQRLCEHNDSEDDDDWNPCKAAGVCLMLLASCVEDDILQHVMPFINDNIKNPNWQFREAAVMAFGSIIEGPSPDKLKPIVEQAIVMFIELLKDSNVIVRDTAAWTIGRICEVVPEAIINENILQPLLEGLVIGLNAEPRVATNACWALSSIAIAAMDMARPNEDEEATPETYVLSKFFEPIIEKLLATTERQDGGQSNLRSAAYEALMEMIKNSPKDCYTTVQKTTIVILGRLENVIKLENNIQSSSDRRQVFDLQSLLCATLQSVLRKVTPEDAPQISDHIMTALLHMLNQTANSKASSVQEDAFLAVSTLIDVLGDKFLKYMDSLKPILYAGLRNFEEHQVCQSAVGVVGDLGRNIGNKILPYCDDIMTILLEGLISPKLNKSVKPSILSTFGDIALATGTDFKKYATVVLNALHQASIIHADPNDFDLIDYFNELREGCLDAYTGILQGLKGNNNTPIDLEIVIPHMNNILEFLAILSKDPNISESVISATCGLIGDLVSCFGPQLLAYVENEAIHSLLNRGKKSKNNRAKTLANWASKEIRKLKSA
ncbi:unnamed protein product [Brachionus calyciflorus]|uniref:Importin N-terminal domain-containing protein n=1 Tax=Brachionus calyciflorus TaxID=104777 RepID=A0A814CTT1_9BILA|nr:unnamed protein product [Brachionus calyciflorus]